MLPFTHRPPAFLVTPAVAVRLCLSTETDPSHSPGRSFYIRGAGFGNADDFFDLLKAEFDYMLQEGIEGRPKMMTVALHSRVIGRPGRIRALKRFMQYVKEREDQAWVTTRDKIALHWREKFPYQGATRLLHAEKVV